MNNKSNTYVLLLFSFIFICTIICCDNDSITKPDNYEDFYLKYNVSGGIAGMSNSLEIYENYNVTYTSSFHRIKKNISQKRLYDIYNLLIDNDYFSFNSQYVTEQGVMDDIYMTITYQSSTRSKTVFVSAYYYSFSDGEWKDKLGCIWEYFDEYITTLTSDIDTGEVTIYSKSILEEWPFSEKLSLSDYLSKDVGIDEEVYNYLKEYDQQDIDVTFFEGEYIYRLNGSGGYGLSYSELDTFYISIHDRNHGILWTIDTKLSEITDEGIIIAGSDYVWLRDTLKETHYPRYFIDNPIESGEYVYEVRLIHGNYF